MVKRVNHHLTELALKTTDRNLSNQREASCSNHHQAELALVTVYRAYLGKW